MDSISLLSQEGTTVVYYKGHKILAVEENPEQGVPQGGTVALVNSREVKRARVFTFRKDQIDRSKIFSKVSEYTGKTDFVCDVIEWKNYYIVTVVSQKTFDIVRRTFNPSRVVPYDFLVVWNIQKQIKKPLVCLKNELFYYISNSDVAVSVLKSDIEPYITVDTVVIDNDTLREFPELQIVPVKRKWVIDKKSNVDPNNFVVRDVEFIVNNTLPINILQDVLLVANKKQLNTLPELRYVLSILFCLIVLLGIRIFSPFIQNMVKPQYTPVKISIPSSIDLDQPTFNEFIYNKGYPYTLYEAYDQNNNKVATFVVKDEAIKWQQLHNNFNLYAVVYDKDGNATKTLLSASVKNPSSEKGPSA